jgi:hypothetical protein
MVKGIQKGLLFGYCNKKLLGPKECHLAVSTVVLIHRLIWKSQAQWHRVFGKGAKAADLTVKISLRVCRIKV